MFFDSDYIQFQPAEDAIAIATQNQALPIVVMEEEHKSVRRVAADLQKDIQKVTGQETKMTNQLPDTPAIIIGTLANQTLLAALEVDTSELEGKWESFLIQTHQLPGHDAESVLILGSDNRGAIYGVYDITERMGVSPWYWWMDVPIKQHEAVYITKGSVLKGEPSVKYRGFFLNDEGPSLMTWVRTHFPDFTHEFYAKIFELTLRLKGNYHWPAMWDSTFYEDDPLNIVTADLYGVVIGTSHHEPMDRPHGDWKAHKKGPWDYAENEDYLKEFWRAGIERSKPYETIINLGMRGDGDEPMGGEMSFKEKTTLMEKIINDQRKLIQETRDVSIEEVPQMWALYKEVKDYYESGMEVPEDVTLLWGDDNFGNIRRLPTKEERQRKGGAGIYYHFDYVGGPRSYKWVNTVPIQKTFEQMQKAYAYDAREVWIVNVGDLKPMEFQTEFFLRLAWDVEAFQPENLDIYAREWAEYTFGEAHGADVARVIRDYMKLNGRIKPEVLNLVEPYSWEKEYEAERVLAEFEETVRLAEKVLEKLPDASKDAFYQVGYYPAVASYNVLKLQLLVDLNKLYKAEGRAATNLVAAEARRLFEKDKQLAFSYNKRVANGKWDHMMDQIHIGYTYWQQPEELRMPEVETLAESEWTDGAWAAKVLATNQTDVYSKKPLAVEVYNQGLEPVRLQAHTQQEWLTLSFTETDLLTQQRLVLKVDWPKVPFGQAVEAAVTIQDESGKQETLMFAVHNPKERLAGGYVPIAGKIAIEAEGFTEKRETDKHKWQIFPDYGRTKSSVAIYPVKLEKDYLLEDAPRLSYDIVLGEETEMTIYVVTAPSLNFDPDRGMRLGLSIDDEKPEVVAAGNLEQDGEQDSPDWENSVLYNAHFLKSSKKTVTAGKHTVHLTLVDPQVVIQKVIIDLGGLEDTYLGPAPTPHSEKLDTYEAYHPAMKPDVVSSPGEWTLTEPVEQLTVYVREAGFYQLKEQGEVVLPVINQQAGQQLAKHSTVYLEQGLQELTFEQPLSALTLTLLKAWPIVMDSSVKMEETARQKERVVQTALHYTGNASAAYRLDAVLLSAEDLILERSATKGYLKTDEQRLHTFVFDEKAVQEAKAIQLLLQVDGWERERILPLNERLDKSP